MNGSLFRGWEDDRMRDVLRRVVFLVWVLVLGGVTLLQSLNRYVLSNNIFKHVTFFKTKS